MLNLFNFLRFKRQAPTSRPPKGYYDLRVSKTTGALVLVDEDAAETPVGSSLASLAVTGNATVGGTLAVTGAATAASLGLKDSLGNTALFDTGNLTADRSYSFPDASGFGVVSDGDTGGTGSAGAGNQYVELNIGGVVYKILHDGTV